MREMSGQCQGFEPLIDQIFLFRLRFGVKELERERKSFLADIRSIMVEMCE